jgi:PKD repeat protein
MMSFRPLSRLRWIPALVLSLCPSAQAQGTVANVLVNPGFEDGFSGWENTSVVASSDAHSGSAAAHFLGSGLLMQRATAEKGKTYKVTYWVKINPGTGCPAGGDCWGGFSVGLANWGGNLQMQNAIPGFITPSSRLVGSWFKESIQFKVDEATSGELRIGPFAGSDWQFDVLVDDVQLFEVTGSAAPSVTIGASTTTVAVLPGEVTFNSTVDDADGSVRYFFWDFGDGGRSNHPNPKHTYVGNGTYPVKLAVVDDDGVTASAQTQVVVNDPSYPRIAIAAPESGTTNTAALSFSGTAQGGGGSAIPKVVWSTDRGLTGTASGTTAWSFGLDLEKQGGRHRVLIVAYDAAGKTARAEQVVSYRPAKPVAVAGGTAGLSANASNVELYDKFEVTFDLDNSMAENPSLPYDTDVPEGIPSGIGVSIDGIFTSPSGLVYAQPGFHYQPHERDDVTRQLHPTGTAVYKIRFAPTELGKWTYAIRVVDASGTSLLSEPSAMTFTAVETTNPNNHGFVYAAREDTRYFEHSDGTHFAGLGPSVHIDSVFGVDAAMERIGGAGSSNLSRTWLSGHSIAGSSWAPWTGGVEYEGNYPGTSLTTEEAYGDGIYSYTLPQQNGSGSRCSFFGFQQASPPIKPNRKYRILVRAKAVGITGPGGFTFRPNVGWPDTCDSSAAEPPVVPYLTGSSDWQVVTATWDSGNTTKIMNSLLTLENVTGGRIYVDEISMREELAGGKLGPEILPRSKFNTHTYFAQAPSFVWDHGLEQFAKHGIYQKAVILEKGDYSYNHISPLGYGYDKGEQMGVVGERSAPLRYQQYFWRYLTARFGYSRAVHSWEYANEQAPGSLTMAEELAKYIHEVDARRHMATTSFWSDIESGGKYFWQDPRYASIDYADVHAYANGDNTSWLHGTDPLTGASTTLDTAIFASAHSLDSWKKNGAGNKPMVMGEAGVTHDGVTAGNDDSDSSGVWLHQFIWAQLNAGGMYFIYWYDQTLRDNDHYGLFRPYRAFMEGKPGDAVNRRIPLNNGSYKDIEATLPAGVRGFGQKDTVNGGAHFWMYDVAYNWFTPDAGSSMAGKTVTFDGLPAKTYVVEEWDTWSGSPAQKTVAHPGGALSVTISAGYPHKDVAVKIYPEVGYPRVAPRPPPPSNADALRIYDDEPPLPDAGLPDGSDSTPPDAGPQGGDASTSGSDTNDGCGCRTAGTPRTTHLSLLLLALSLCACRRRRGRGN